MYLVRQFFGTVPHRMSPTLLVATTAPLAAVGLFMFGNASTPVAWFVAAALLAVGTSFWWPTMIGMTSERFPRGGALVLAVIGASGSVATAIAGPVMGRINDVYGAASVLPIWAALPTVLTLIFAALYLRDRATGGYKIERL
jgi:MFS family permease